MKAANRILNILVLLAAIAAAVCAYLLFQKREQITKGREMMASGIVKAVKNLDKSAKLSASEMSIAKDADELKAPLKVLDDRVAKILKQRLEIAQTLADASNNVMTPADDAKFTADSFVDYATTSQKTTEAAEGISKRMNYFHDRNDKVKSGLNDVAAKLNLDPMPEDSFTFSGDADNSKLADGLKNVTERAGKYVERVDSAASHIEKISTALEIEKTPNLSVENDAFLTELGAQLENVEMFAKTKRQLEVDKKRLEETEKELRVEIKKKNDELKEGAQGAGNLKQKLAAANLEIKRLRKIIDPNADDEAQGGAGGVLRDESALQRKLIGKITYTNDHFGFVVIDLGRMNTVEDKKIDPDSGKEIIVKKNVALPADGIMTIASSLDPKNASYIGRAVVMKVGARSAVINVVPNPGYNMPKVGDVVFFSESDLAQMRAIREAAVKKMEEVAAKERAKAAEERAKAAEDAILAGEEEDAAPAKEEDGAKKDASDEAESDDSDSDEKVESSEEDEELEEE